ncbi:RNA polymerase sigma-54 factor, RpoN [Desulfurispirillum indicum S5]|uniref:RNA polymerase sigma-54 factor, RpoN n=1 Tax=Desulfurispirillum indicum (strain ATCC BAA-1389 / DSM 22839 / S5) TaxID=653733 RepID=E6W108_DESIS|nr:RNA polymerase factor sigma-54 [Desulfurispirillum indicum]ADU65340.1 RNA polymerase sigma-54 factor, RpoN [Desulfurispirillum indicum S5]
MRTGMSLGQTQTLQQSLVMTPALQQAIKLLQLSRLELEEQIETELLENPVLEAEPAGSTDEWDEVPAQVSEGEKEINDFENYLNSYGENFSEGASYEIPDDEYETPIKNRESFTAMLLGQLGLMKIGEEQRGAAYILVNNLDEDGYLRVPLEELASEHYPVALLEEVLVEVVQNLEPLGVGSRSIKEFLLVQLENMSHRELTAPYDVVRGIIEKFLEEMDKKGLKKITRVLKCTEEEALEAIALIRDMEPVPAQGYVDDENSTVIPDVYYVKDKDGQFLVLTNDDGLPRLNVNHSYIQLAKSAPDKESYAYIERKYQAAKWFIKSIEQRQKTILRVAQSILKFQGEFFHRGPMYLKGLNLREVADDIGVHESTVSRVTTSKYAHTPYGIYELKFFFGSGIKGGSLSVDVLKHRLREIIEGENPQKPLSDEKLVSMLAAEGFDVARRTVAKYRADLGIPTASARKNKL